MTPSFGIFVVVRHHEYAILQASIVALDLVNVAVDLVGTHFLV